MDKETKPKEVNTSNLGLKVEGDLGDLQVTVEDDSDSGEETTVACSIPNIPNGLIQNTNAPIIGSAAVTHSDNVQFGNNTYFTGPVIIKQLIKPKTGIVNPSYVNTESESPLRKATDTVNNLSRRFQCTKWHKISLCVIIIVVIIAVICAIVFTAKDTTIDKTISEEEGGEGLLIGPDHLRIVSRINWLAQPPTGPLDLIKTPVPWVIISHTATAGCEIQSECVLSVRLVQSFHIESRKWSDIGYNFLVGGDGSIYNGRGWNYIGAHTLGYNKYSIGVAFIGTFTSEAPPKQQLDACQKLLYLGVKKGYLAKDYKLFGHRQLMTTQSPGEKLLDIIKEWPHFVKNVSEVTVPSY